jgi:aspartokinase/homoserine dehydrogenase 1
MAKGIPICIRNTFNPSSNGTEISANGARPGSRSKIYPYIVKGFSLIENVALVNVEGTGMCGVPGVAERIFSALKSASLSVILITQVRYTLSSIR